MAYLEVEKIRRIRARWRDIRAFGLGQPQRGDCASAYQRLHVAGWVIGRRQRVTHVEVRVDDACLLATPVERVRADVVYGRRFRGAEPACGFVARAQLPLLQDRTAVELWARLEDGRCQPLCALHVRLHSQAASYRPRVTPLLVTSWNPELAHPVLRALACLPDVAVPELQQADHKPVSYWVQAYQVLTAPTDREHSARPENFAHHVQRLGYNPFFRPQPGTRTAQDLWLDRDYPEEVAAFCLQQADESCRALAGNDACRLVAESVQYNHVAMPMRSLYREAREVFVILDPRQANLPREAARELLTGWRLRRRSAGLLRLDRVSAEDAVTSLLDIFGIEADGALREHMAEELTRKPKLVRHPDVLSPAEAEELASELGYKEKARRISSPGRPRAV